MELRTECPLRKKICVDAAYDAPWHLSEYVRSAALALRARRCPEGKGFSLSALY
jgi:hypothetical protein